MEFLKDLVELLKTLLEDTALPDWLKSLVVFAVIMLVLVSLFQKVLVPVGKALKSVYEKVTRRLFINRNMYPYFTELTPREVYEAIQYYIPTRYSRRGLDPANEEEPVPENFTKEQEREGYPLLLNRFLETEFDSSKNNRFYFVLADCGMGKTTFLMNLFYYTLLRKKRHPCKYINMVNPGVIDAVKAIKAESGAKTSETILLLDALDENDAATRNYAEFMRELEEETREFYCVVITSRTNFFEKAEEEHLPGVKRGERVTQDKIVKFYITPFTDTDIQKYLKRRYPLNRKKQKQAWAMMEDNKKLAARPMLLKFMDDLFNDDFTFDYDFQLYGKLFDLWISRECDKTGKNKMKLFQECLEVAKAIYAQWKKTRQIGISLQELEAFHIQTHGISNIELKGHALINRTNAGIYKFAHISYWEYLLAYLTLHDREFMKKVNICEIDRANDFFVEMVTSMDFYYFIIFFYKNSFFAYKNEEYFLDIYLPSKMRNNAKVKSLARIGTVKNMPIKLPDSVSNIDIDFLVSVPLDELIRRSIALGALMSLDYLSYQRVLTPFSIYDVSMPFNYDGLTPSSIYDAPMLSKKHYIPIQTFLRGILRYHTNMISCGKLSYNINVENWNQMLEKAIYDNKLYRFADIKARIIDYLATVNKQ